MKLKELLTKLEYQVMSGSDEIEITHLQNDSRKVQLGDVFVCIKGAGFDGHKFVKDVAEKGAVAVVVMDDVEIPEGLTVIRVENTRYALACMSADYFGNPAEKITTIGITGTKGKTTTSYMVRSVLESIGIKTGLIGTIETIVGDHVTPANNTTPESFVVQQTFQEMVDAGCECVIMEVSSQGLMQDRVSGFTFDYGIFTNIEPDHIGPNEHKDFDDYLNCKKKLLSQCKQGIVNMDADFIDRVLDGHTCELETFGVNGDYDFTAKNIELFTKPGCLCVSYDLNGKLNFPVEIHVPGNFSVYNSLCAIAICSHFTKDTEKMQKALEDVRVKGRVEIIPISKRFTLMIDYAHNAMSLESLLLSLKQYEPKRLVTLFGCGGNRSKDRRYEMGEVSSRLSDFTIVTSDNPRFEEPMDIIDDILIGVHKADGKYVTIPDRKDAIRYAILNAEDGDVIILAGKGHEDYQEIKGVKHPMDERVLISEIIAEDEVKKVL
ncbi:MAG: UDP-N-acetylmuramoyl-L-alanyl-D-glutamate--2,6-diaminopimelate ligase [Eubacterium sp.]|nr:UDP-N-acetylmuramoyl-L-alanyl-D-glutamate--2,6-diaminopimelate ligase [Eubacterium sp.]